VANQDERVEVVVALEDGVPLERVVAALEQAGLASVQRLAELHAVTGSIASSSVSALEAVPGVRAVERSRRVALPPPDAPVQ
jgi:hypothetical protein